MTKMIHEPNCKRIYALSETSISVCDLRTQSVKVRLHEIHEAPVTCVCWYSVDQYYITACSRGQICCWSPRPSPVSAKGGYSSTLTSTKPPPHTLLHSFHAHSKSINGLAIHPSPGMFITAGQDGYIKVWDFEIYSLLQSITLDAGITHFKVCQYNNSDVCIFGLTTGEAAMWKINSCCSEFRLCASDVVSLTSFDSFVDPDGLEENPIRYHDSDEVIPLNPSEIDHNENDGLDEEVMEDSRPPTAIPPTLAALEAGILDETMNLNRDQERKTPNSKPSSRRSKKPSDNSRQQVLPTISVVVSAPLNGLQLQDPNTEPSMPSPTPPELSNLERTIVAFAGNDLQVITTGGTLKSRVEPDALVEGVSAIAFSVFQQLLFCLMENSHIRIFCTKSSICVLLREVYVGAIGSDEPSALVMADNMTLAPNRASSTSRDMRGNPSPLNFEEILAIGTSSGTLICLDTFQECQTVLIQQIYYGRVDALKYRRLRKELIGLGRSLNSSDLVIKVWKVPDMILMHEIVCDTSFSCWEMSLSYSMICVGCNDGFSRLFNLVSDILVPPSSARIISSRSPSPSRPMTSPQDFPSLEEKNQPTNQFDVAKGRHIEVIRQEGGHESAIIAISFCDELRAYATSSLDCTLKFWDFEKRLIKSILFNAPSKCILFTIPVGNILLTQGRHISSIAREVWEEKGLLQIAKESEDPWERISSLQEDDLPLSRGLASKIDGTNGIGEEEVGLLIPERLYESTTFLTEEQRTQFDLSLLSYGIVSSSFTGDMEEYWRHHSSLATNSKRGRKLDVRNPKYKVKPPEGKKRFAAKLREKRLTEEENETPAQEYEIDYDAIEGDNNTRAPEGTIIEGEDEDDDGITDGRKSTMVKDNSKQQRNAFIRTARVVQATTSLLSSTRKSTISGSRKTNITSTRKTNLSRTGGNTLLKPTPPTSSMSSAVHSLLKHQLSIGVQSKRNQELPTQLSYFNDEYHIKPNGPHGTGNDMLESYQESGGGPTRSSSKSRRDIQRYTQFM